MHTGVKLLVSALYNSLWNPTMSESDMDNVFTGKCYALFANLRKCFVCFRLGLGRHEQRLRSLFRGRIVDPLFCVRTYAGQMTENFGEESPMTITIQAV